MHRLFLFESFFQCVGRKGRQVYPLKTVLCRQHIRLGQVVAGYDLAFFFGLGQKFSCALGGTGIVHVENADHGALPHRHIITDG